MNQDIITLIIVAAATMYTFYRIYMMLFTTGKKSAAHCSGCTGCSIQTRIVTSKK